MVPSDIYNLLFPKRNICSITMLYPLTFPTIDFEDVKLNWRTLYKLTKENKKKQVKLDLPVRMF